MGFLRKLWLATSGRRRGDAACAPAATASPDGARASARSATRSVAAALWRRLGWKLRLLVLLPLTALLAATGSGCLAIIYYTFALPDPHVLGQRQRPPVVRILARDGSSLAERGASYDYVPIVLLPRHVWGAVVATEDRRFYSHWGVDLSGLARAALANLRAGRYAQGGSTLTQQLAKNLFLRPERTIGRKLEELLLAFWLESRLSKDEILEIYLNRVYFGGGAYGIEAAAHRYFGKPARALTIAEAAVVAGILKAPSRFAPTLGGALARARARTVVAGMQQSGVITAAEAQAAAMEPLAFLPGTPQKALAGAEYAVDLVLERLPALVGGGGGDLIVETTIDAGLQRVSQAILHRAMQAEGARSEAEQAAALVLDDEGGIRALIGGHSYQASQFNRAVKARRQPGSAFKPFVYLAALEAGMGPESTTYDLPITIDGWSPRNESGTYRGAVTLRQGLATSINSVAVRLLQDVGARRVITTARRLGIRSELRAEPSLALGTSEVTLAELTAGYVPFANGGHAVEPHIIQRVRTGNGRVLYERPQRTQTAGRAVSLTNVGAMNDMLNATLVSGTGRRAAIPAHPAAGKTGTSQDFRDAWFIGYTAHFTAGVWVGNDKGRSMNRVMGGGLPARIWRDLMLLAHEGKPPMALAGTVMVERRDPAEQARPADRQPVLPGGSINRELFEQAARVAPDAAPSEPARSGWHGARRLLGW